MSSEATADIRTLVEALENDGVELWGEGNRLRYRGRSEAMIPAALDALAQRKAEVLALLRERPGRLSQRQLALRMLHEIAPANCAYNLHYAVRLQTGLDVDALQRAFRRLLDRHPVLRSRYPLDDGQFRQRTEAAAALEVIDATAWSEARLTNDLSCEAERPFDLAHGPIMRQRLMMRPDGRSILQLVVHHIAVDFWSMDLLLRELSVLYRAECGGVTEELPAPVPYDCFVVSERHGLKDDADWMFWRDRLGVLPEPLDLIGTLPRPSVETLAGDTFSTPVPESLATLIQARARQLGVTPFVTCLAAFQVLLLLHSGQEQWLMGTPTSGRSEARWRNTVGNFANLAPLRADLRGNPTFTELVERVREELLGALDHANLPFSLLVERLHLERDRSRSPLFQIAFAWERSIWSSRSDGGASTDDMVFERLAAEQRGSAFDLRLAVFEEGPQLTLNWQYSTALFEHAMIERLQAHYLGLLSGLCGRPEARLGELELLGASEREALEAWGCGPRFEDGAVSIVEVFRRIAARFAERTALQQGEVQWSYGELDRRSDALAAELRAHGVGPGVLVGVAGERSPELVLALLGVVKAGGAYLPLELSYPAERLSYMLEDARPALLLADEAALDVLPGFAGPVLPLAGSGAASFQTPAADVAGSSLAYVMYTSGSTGRPKGVCVTHRGVVRLAIAGQFAALDESEVLLLAAPIAFDASTFELWGALLNGARLVLAPPGPLSLDMIAALIATHAVSTLWLTTDLFRLMTSEQAAAMSSLRQVLTGGDVVPAESCRQFLRSCPEVALINGYGPTENTTFTTTHRITAADAAGLSIPIGRPIGGTQVWVVDDSGRPLPAGAPGELWIGGAGLAQGYLNDAARSAERFVRSHWLGDGTWYRSGDRVRWRSDGVLEFLGRSDGQVKLRGHRVELGEIEAVLAGHPGVAGCVAAVSRGASGEKQLAGYVVARAERRPTLAELQGWLASRLPSYMVPSRWVWLDAIPLSANGKVDRKRLPAPDVAGTADEAPARSQAEAELAQIWRELLGLEQVGVHDNFFALGGDSILSIQMVSRSGARGLKLTAQDVFRRPTIAELAALCGAREGPQTELAAEQGVVLGEAPLSPIQHWYVQWPGQNWERFSQGAWLELRPDVDCEALSGALNAVAVHHDALRLCWERTAQGWRQEITAPVTVEIGIEDLSACADPEAALQASAQRIQASLRIGEGRLWTARLYRMAGGWRLLWLAHHGVVDAVSWRILLEDLGRAYAALARGAAPALPAKTLSWRAWTQHLAEWAQGLDAVELGLWREMEASGFRLPMDSPGGDNRVASEARVSLSLAEAETEALLRKAGRAYRTRPEEMLLAALGQTLTAWAGDSCCVLDVESHGRDGLDAADLSRTVGWFTSLYPLRLDLGGAGPGEILKAVKERCRAVPRGGIGYGALRYLRPDAGLDGPPRELCFNYLGQWRIDATADPVTAWLGEAPGGARSPEAQRRYAIDVVAHIHQGRLHVDWLYSTELHQAATMHRLAATFEQNLRDLISHCLDPNAGGLTPSDVPLARLSQNELDDIVQLLADA